MKRRLAIFLFDLSFFFALNDFGAAIFTISLIGVIYYLFYLVFGKFFDSLEAVAFSLMLTGILMIFWELSLKLRFWQAYFALYSKIFLRSRLS